MHQNALVPARLVGFGFQTLTSLPNLAEEMMLTAAISHIPVAVPELAASSLLTEQEINAHLQAPATVGISHTS